MPSAERFPTHRLQAPCKRDEDLSDLLTYIYTYMLLMSFFLAACLHDCRATEPLSSRKCAWSTKYPNPIQSVLIQYRRVPASVFNRRMLTCCALVANIMIIYVVGDSVSPLTSAGTVLLADAIYHCLSPPYSLTLPSSNNRASQA